MKTRTPFAWTQSILHVFTALILGFTLSVEAQNNTNSTVPIATIRAADADATWQGDPGLFIVMRQGPTNFALNLFYTIRGSAENGVDYAPIANWITIPEGVRSNFVRIVPKDLGQSDRRDVVLTLAYPPTLPPINYLIGTPSNAVVNIHPEAPPQTNYPPVVHITSPPNGAIFRGPVNIPIFAYAFDRQEAIASVEFFNGSNSLGLGEPVTGRSNVVGAVNATNTFVLVWTNAPLGQHVLSALATTKSGETGRSERVGIAVLTSPPPPTNRPALVSIIAKDPISIEGTNCWVWPGLIDSNLGWRNWPTGTCRLYTNCGPKNASFLVRRQGATNDALTVKYHVGGSATNGVDYVPLSGEVTIPAGERAVLISVVPIDDSIPERRETVVLRLKPSLDVVPTYLLGRPASAAALIVDGDRITSSGMLADRSFHLSATGPDGAWFRVETSSDMTDWTPVTYGQVINGSIDFVDPDAEGAPTRFYRAVPELTVPVE